MASNERTRVAVLGVGAVGGYFAAVLARRGVHVTALARAAQVEAIRRDGVVVVESGGEWRARLDATDDPRAAREAQLVLLAVKSGDTSAASEQLRPHLRPDTPVLSLQNGVDNAERIARVIPNPVYAAVVYVGAEADAPGRIRHTGRGDLVIGLPRNVRAVADPAGDLAAISRIFEGAGVRCPVSDDIDAALWTKLAINCGCNAISALLNARYGAMLDDPATRDLMERIVRETVAIAIADGVRLDADSLVQAVWNVAGAMRMQQSSTAQDLQRGKATEIDALNGFVVRRAETLGRDAPINRTLHALVKARERRP